MFTNIDYLGYNINNPLSIPQCIKDCIFLNIIEDIQKDKQCPVTVDILKQYANCEDENGILDYYTNLINKIINIFGENKDDKEDTKEIDIFNILSHVDISLWNYPLPAILAIRKSKDIMNKNNELRLFNIIEQAVLIIAQTDEEGRSLINKSREEFIHNFFEVDNEQKKDENPLPEHIKEFPKKLQSFCNRNNNPFTEMKS